MTLPLLAARNLEYHYPGGIRALRALDLKIYQGRKLAILGPNGSGKTTLLLHLNGTFRPTQGAILLDGHAVAYDRRALDCWRSRVGLVLQEPDDQLFAATVEQDISFGPLNLGLSEAAIRERVNEALAALEISQLAPCPIHTLSFGQKKRVAIAGVLAMRPEILVLDEPTAGLDPISAEILKEKILAEKAKGKLVLVTSHILSDLEELTTDVMYIIEGKVQFYQSIEALKTRTGEGKLNRALAQVMKQNPSV